MAPKYQYKEEHGVQWLLVFYHNAHDNIILDGARIGKYLAHNRFLQKK